MAFRRLVLPPSFVLGLSLALVASCEPAHVPSARQDPLAAAETLAAGSSTPEFAPSGTPAQYAPDSVVDVEHAAIAVVPDLVARELAGFVEYRVRLLDPMAREITLHAVDLRIDTVTVDGRAATLRHDDEHVYVSLPDASEPRQHGQTLVISLQWRAQPRIGLYFFGPDTPEARGEALREGDEPRSGRPGKPGKPGKAARKRERGLPERHESLQAWTQGEMHETRHWLPTWDYPNDRFTTSWTIAAARGLTVIANGASQPLSDIASLPSDALRDYAVHALGRDASVWRFEQQQDHVSYLLSMIVGRFDRVAHEWRGKPVEYFMPQGQAAHAEPVFGRTPAMLDFYSSYVGVEFPWAKYAQTPVQEFTFGGMENVSATTVTDRSVFPAHLAGVEDRDSLVAHELSHQWWGDLLTCREWAHIWLNEGFATYFTALWFEHAEGSDGFDLHRRGMARSYFDEAKRYERAIVTREYRNAAAMFDRHTYPKGGWVLHMLRRELGDAAFQRAIHLYARGNAFGLVETADLQRAVREASGRSLDWFFDQWVFSPGHPRLRARWRWDASSSALVVELEQLQAKPFAFALDLAWLPSGPGAQPQQRRVRVEDARVEIVLPADTAPHFVVVDPGMHLLAELEVEQPDAAWREQLRQAQTALDRIRAAEALATRGGAASVAALEQAARGDASEDVRLAAIAGLGRIGDAPAQRVLLELWKHERARPAGEAAPKQRRAILSAFAQAKAPVGADELALVEQALRDDPIDHVRAAAATAMRRFASGKLRTRAVKQLRGALEQRSFHELVEEAAAKSLAAIGDAGELELLLALIEARRPTFLRIAGIEALLDLRKREGVLSDAQRREVAASLAALAHDPNMRIRRAIIDDLAQLELPDAKARLEALARSELDGRVLILVQDELRELR